MIYQRVFIESMKRGVFLFLVSICLSPANKELGVMRRSKTSRAVTQRANRSADGSWPTHEEVKPPNQTPLGTSQLVLIGGRAADQPALGEAGRGLTCAGR